MGGGGVKVCNEEGGVEGINFTLSSQSSLTAMLLGFKSRWMIPAEWTYCK